MAYSFIPLLRGTDANEARRSHQQHGVVYFTKIAERIRTDLAKKKVVLVPFPRATPDIDRDGLGCFELPSNCRVGPRKMYHHSSPFFFISIFYFFGFIFIFAILILNQQDMKSLGSLKTCWDWSTQRSRSTEINFWLLASNRSQDRKFSFISPIRYFSKTNLPNGG